MHAFVEIACLLTAGCQVRRSKLQILLGRMQGRVWCCRLWSPSQWSARGKHVLRWRAFAAIRPLSMLPRPAKARLRSRPPIHGSHIACQVLCPLTGFEQLCQAFFMRQCSFGRLRGETSDAAEPQLPVSTHSCGDAVPSRSRQDENDQAMAALLGDGSEHSGIPSAAAPPQLISQIPINPKPLTLNWWMQASSGGWRRSAGSTLRRWRG